MNPGDTVVYKQSYSDKWLSGTFIGPDIIQGKVIVRDAKTKTVRSIQIGNQFVKSVSIKIKSNLDIYVDGSYLVLNEMDMVALLKSVESHVINYVKQKLI